MERRPIANDRRSYALHLSDKGRGLAARGLEAQREYVRRTLGKLAPGDLAGLERLVLAWRAAAREFQD